MTKRLFALVLALAVVSAPAALEVCQISCESKTMPRSMMASEDHAGHHHVPADHASCHEAGARQVSPGSVPCDHGTEATPSLVATRNPEAAVSLLAVVPLNHSIVTFERCDFVSVRQSAWADRLVVPLAIPLRV